LKSWQADTASTRVLEDLTMSPVIVLWAGESSKTLSGLGDQLDAVVVPLDAATFLGALPSSMTREGVVAVVTDAEAAERALALGADEVLPAERADTDLGTAIARARLRACARASREARLVDEICRADGEALELLVAAIAHELRTPLAVAALNSEMLRGALGAVTGAADEIARWVAASVPPPVEELRRMVAMRLAAPPTAEIDATATDLAEALRQAIQTVKQMSALARDGTEGQCDLSAALWQVEGLMRGMIERTATFVVDVPPSPLRIALARAELVQSIAALLSNACQACAEVGGDNRRIELRLLEHQWMAIVEVFDNGAGMAQEVRRRAMHPFFTTRRPGALGLGLTIAAARVRCAGGDIMIESDAGVGTRVRVFFPSMSATAKANGQGGADEN
jgi:signal transduction histidine kinase